MVVTLVQGTPYYFSYSNRTTTFSLLCIHVGANLSTLWSNGSPRAVDQNEITAIFGGISPFLGTLSPKPHEFDTQYAWKKRRWDEGVMRKKVEYYSNKDCLPFTHAPNVYSHTDNRRVDFTDFYVRSPCHMWGFHVARYVPFLLDGGRVLFR